MNSKHKRQHFAEIREKSNPDDRAKIDACTNIIDKQVAPDPEIRSGIQNSEFRIIDQIISQNVNKACSSVETTVIQQAERVGNHSAQQFQHHGNGICTFINEKHEETRGLINRIESIVSSQEFFQKQIADQIGELSEEIKQLRDSPSHLIPMDLPRDELPSPDQDSNGCLDGNMNTNEIRDEQAKVLKEIKETAKQHDAEAEASSTLHNKANDGDMNKSPNKKKKSALNAEQVPGSPECAKIKNRGINGVKYIEQNEFWADPQINKSKVPIIVKDPYTGREVIDYEVHEFEAKDDYNYKPTKSAKKRMRKRRLDDATRSKSEVVVHGLEETIDKDDIELFWFSEAKTFIKFTEELSPTHLGEKDGIELTLEDIKVTNRILVWSKHDENNPLPMVVKLKDEKTANSVLRAMFAAGCYKRRMHVKRGKYKKKR